MKNIKTFFLALASASLLSGCGANAKWEQVSYKRVLDNGEKAVLLAKVAAAMSEKVSKYEINYSRDVKTEQNVTHAEAKANTEFFANGEAYAESKYKSKQKYQGAVTETEEKETKAFVNYDKEAFALFTENSVTGFTFAQHAVPEGYESYAVINELDDVFYELSDDACAAVENNKGQQFFVYSSEVDTYTPEAAGHEKRIEHSIHREQTLCYLNKDFTIKSFTLYESVQTNLDPYTNNLTKKVKTILEEKTSYSFKYGKRGDGSKKLSSYRDTAKNGYALLPGFTFSSKLLKQDGTELGALQFNKISEKQLSFSKKHLIYTSNEIPTKVGDDGVNSIKLLFAGQSGTNTSKDNVAIDVEILVGSLSAGSSGMSLDNGKLKMGKATSVVTLEFDVEATSSGAIFSNVFAYANISD